MTSPSVKSTLIHVIEGEWEREKGGEMWGIVLSYSISSPLLVPWQWEKRNSGNKLCSGPRTDMTYIWLSKCTSSFPIGPLEGVTGGLTVHLHVSVLGEKTLCQSQTPPWQNVLEHQILGCFAEENRLEFTWNPSPSCTLFWVLSKHTGTGKRSNTQTWTWSNKQARMKHYLVGEVVG